MQKTAKYTIILMSATLIAKLMGFVRELSLAYSYGAGAVSDAYVIAFSIPTVIFAGLGTAIMTCYITLYSQIEVENPQKLERFHNNTTTIVVLLSVLVTVGFQLLATPIVKLFAVGFSEGHLAFTVELSQIMMASLLFIGLSYMVQGYLQIKGGFLAVGLVSVPLNIFVIASILMAGEDGASLTLGLGAVIGYAVALIMLIVAAAKRGYSYRPTFSLTDGYLKRLAVLVLPVFLGKTIMQINALIDRSIASTLPEGSVSALNYANRVFGVVTSVFVVSLVMAIFPKLSRQSAHKNIQSIKRTTRSALGMVTLIVLPISAALIWFAEPIVRILFARGAFDETAVQLTADCLVFYSIGLIFYSFKDVLINVFYSMQKSQIPTANSVIAVILNVVLNLILIRVMEHSGLALATSLSSAITTVILMFSLRKYLGNMGWGSLLVSGVKMLIATVLMLAVAAAAFGLTTNAVGTDAGDLVPMLAAAASGALVYAAALVLLRTKEMGELVVGAYNLIKKRSAS